MASDIRLLVARFAREIQSDIGMTSIGAHQWHSLLERFAAELTTLREREAAAVPSGWRAFDPAIMQDLGWYIVEFADNSVGMDVWEAEDGWQEIDPDSTVSRVYLMPLPGAPEPQAAGLREVEVETVIRWLEGRAKWADAPQQHLEDTSLGAGLRNAARVMRALAKTPPQGE